MNRRSFLRLFGAAAPIIAAKPTYFFAPIGGWESAEIVNPFLNNISASTLDDWVDQISYQNFFVSTPLQAWARIRNVNG